jgi:large subunit ribosomal protein L6
LQGVLIMSRIGKQPISVPTGVTITIDADNITITGPKGTLSQAMLPGITLESTADGVWLVKRASDIREHRSKHGLMRTLVNNMVLGVTQGFSKQLEINGVGFRANIEGQKLRLAVGFSHNVLYEIPQGINITVEQNIITVSGISKQLVGQTAAEIRAIKKPEPYKGKGIKYVNERIIRKSGKSGKEKA